uniref:Uncharacterized protein n=1 Tax=Anopheles culicifacies TaxID=139723 RepID=A0A182M8N9_9DIPT
MQAIVSDAPYSDAGRFVTMGSHTGRYRLLDEAFRLAFTSFQHTLAYRFQRCMRHFCTYAPIVTFVTTHKKIAPSLSPPRQKNHIPELPQPTSFRLSIVSECHLLRSLVTPVAIDKLAALVVAVTAGLIDRLSLPRQRLTKYTIGIRMASSSPTAISAHCTMSSRLSTFIRLSSISFTMSSFSAIPSSIQMTGNSVGCNRSVSLMASIRRRNMLNCTLFPPVKGVPVYCESKSKHRKCREE